MGLILQPDDFKVGLRITVHSGRVKNSILKGLSPGSPDIAIQQEESCLYKGEVLEIASIMLPYIVVKHISKWDHNQGDMVKLDTRGMKFMKVTEDYVNAMLTPNSIMTKR